MNDRYFVSAIKTIIDLVFDLNFTLVPSLPGPKLPGLFFV